MIMAKLSTQTYDCPTFRKSARLLVAAFMCLLATHKSLAECKYYFSPIDKQFDQIAIEINRADYDNERQGINPSWLDKLDSIAKKSNNRQLKARAIYWRVRSTQMDAQPSLCLPMLKEALKNTDAVQYPYDAARIHYQLAGNYNRLRQYLNCYNEVKQAIPVFDKANDYFFLGNSYLLLVQLFIDIGNNEEALAQLQLARQSYEKAGSLLNRIHFFQALLTDDAEKKITLYKKAIETGKNDWGMTLQAYISLNEQLLKLGRTQEAETYSQEAFMLLNKYSPGNVVFKSMIAVNHANLRFEQGRYQEALAELNQLLQHTEQLSDESLMKNIYQLLWQTHDKLNHQEEAFKYLKLFNMKFQEDMEKIQRHEVPKAQAREAIARQNDQIRLLEQSAELNRRLLWAICLGALVVLLSLGGLLLFFYQRYRMRKMENRELQKSLEQEAIIYSMNLKNYENDIQKKDREISSSTLLLTNKNEVLRQLSEITSRYGDEGKVPKEFVKEVNNVIGDSLRNDDEWSRFRLHFDAVHPDFFSHLKEAAADLTENDLRLCAYIRIGMRAKQIAEMLSISSDSVNSNRYRLRKKLGLERGDSLDDFLRKI